MESAPQGGEATKIIENPSQSLQLQRPPPHTQASFMFFCYKRGQGRLFAACHPGATPLLARELPGDVHLLTPSSQPRLLLLKQKATILCISFGRLQYRAFIII